MGLFLFAVYGFVGFFALLIAKDNILDNTDIDKTTLSGYLFLFLSFLLFFRPFLSKKNAITANKLKAAVNFPYIVFSYVYIACSIISLVICFSLARSMLSVGDWQDSYGRKNIYPYSNFIEYFSLNFVNYTRMMALVVGFSLLKGNGYNKDKKILSIVLIISAVLTAINEGIISTSRSMLFDILLIVIAFSIFFFKTYTKKVQLFLIVVGSIGAFFSISLLIAITFSRFSDRGVQDNLISYLGQSPIVFNSQVFNSLNSFAFGRYGWGELFGISKFSPGLVGGTWGTRFYTFVGYLFIDWGFIGVIIIGLIINFFFSLIAKKNRIGLADLFLVFTYYQFLIKGVFVIGRTYYLTIILTVLIYAIMKLLDTLYLFKNERKVCLSIR